MQWPKNKPMSPETAQKLIDALCNIETVSDSMMEDGDYARNLAQQTLYFLKLEAKGDCADYQAAQKIADRVKSGEEKVYSGAEMRKEVLGDESQAHYPPLNTNTPRAPYDGVWRSDVDNLLDNVCVRLQKAENDIEMLEKAVYVPKPKLAVVSNAGLDPND